MRRLIKPGRIMFALAIVSLGILQFFTKEYIIGRPPSPEWLATIPGKQLWAYVSGGLLIVAGILIIINRKVVLASLFIAALIILVSFFLRFIPFAIKNTPNAESLIWHINAYKSLALAGGGLISAAIILNNKRLISISVLFLAIFLVVCGMAHLKFYDFVAGGFIPAYIPSHPFWTYLTAIALINGGIGLYVRPIRKWAALLSGIMILLWFLLLHIPRASYTPNEYAEWMGVFESFCFAGIFFMLAGVFAKQDRFAYVNEPAIDI